MPETKSPQGGLTRRGFLKSTAAAGALGLAGAGGMIACDSWLASADQDTVGEHVAYTYHTPNCGNRCALKCTVRDGRLVHIEANKWTKSEECFSVCCLKGINEVQRVYSADRIQTPLRRIGERGSGEFEAISWDEALDIVCEKLAAAKEKSGGKSIFFTYSSGTNYDYPLLRKLLCCQSLFQSGIDMGVGNGIGRTVGNPVGAAMHEINDWINSKLVILASINPAEAGLTDTQFIFNAQEAGAEVVVIDPVYTVTAQKADRWIPINPGTDAALYLAMISVVLDNGLQDETFLLEHTLAGCLVGEDGKLLRKNSEIQETDTPQTNPYLIWNTLANDVAEYTNGEAVAALEGTFEVNGSKVTTAFTLLKENQKQYTPDWAAEITGIPADVITDLALKYASGPTYWAAGTGGADKFSNSDIVGHAASVLHAVTGNIGKPGAGLGTTVSHYFVYGSLQPMGTWPLPEEFAESPAETQTSLFKLMPTSVDTVINIGNTFPQVFGNFKTTREWLKTLDFILTVDIYHNDSVNWSDVVLPACSVFEYSEDCGFVMSHKNHILLQEKVIDPLFESKPDIDIEREIADRMGYGQYVPRSTREYVDKLLDVSDPAYAGINYESLVENSGLMRLAVPETPFNLAAMGVYFTGSGMVELYHDEMVEFNQACPNFEYPQELEPGNALREKYPLVFIQNRRRYAVHSQFLHSSWITQIEDVINLHISPADARERGLEDGDTIQIFNDRATVEMPCRVDGAIRPGMVMLTEGAWLRDLKGQSWQDLVNETMVPRSAKLPYGGVIPFFDTLVEVRKA